MSNQKTCLITGATRGLGYALARDAAKRGLHVIALGRTQGGLDDLADEIDNTKGSITMVPMDITDDDAIAYMAQTVFERWKKLDYWLHTAWFTAPMQPTTHLFAKDLDEAWKTNIRATARLIAMLDPILRNTKNAKAVFFDDPKDHGAHLSNIGMSKTAQMEIVKNWQKEARKIGPHVRIETPQPFFGHLQSTLYPGQTGETLSTAEREAERILDMLMVE